MDVVIATLQLKMQAVPVSVWVAVNEWRGWGVYASVTTELANGGRHVDGALVGRETLEGIDALLPRAFSFDPARANEARPLNTPEEAQLASKVSLFWQVPDCGCSGFNIEALNHVIGIERRLQVRAVSKDNCWCGGQPTADDSTLRRALKPKAGSGDERYDDAVPAAKRTAIWVSGLPAGMPFHFPNYQFPHEHPGSEIRVTARPYIVRRVMNEVDRVSPAEPFAVATLNDNVQCDELWVPATFLIDAYYSSGVKRTRPIFVVPDAVDVHLFDPESVEPATEIADNSTYDGHYKFFVNSRHPNRAKGYDVLFRAYFTTFTAKDKVVLLIKTYLMESQLRSSRSGQGFADPHSNEVIEAWVRSYVRSNLNVSADNMAAFAVVGAGAVGAAAMPRLYKAVDCYVMPSRGEGWGYPLHEAMAMGLPTIGTNWSGNAEFMNATNSLLVDVLGLEDPANPFGPGPVVRTADERSKRGWDKTPLHARPSWRTTAKHMRWAFDHPAEAKSIGAVARKHIVQYFSREAVAQIVFDRVADMKRRIDTGRQ
jgi:glycosyltransferase involved in cell wall biosynthesis